MEEFFRSVGEAIRKRAASAFLGTYTFFWALLHWQGLYTTLFTSEDTIFEKYGLLKNEYVATYFFGAHGWGDWKFYAGFVGPLLLTYLFIWWLPRYVLLPAFAKERSYRLKKQEIIIQNEIDLEKSRAKLAAESEKTLLAKEREKKQQKAVAQIDPTVTWQQEYDQLMNDALAETLVEITEAVYKHEGHITQYRNKEGVWVGLDIDTSGIAVAHANGLIDIKGGLVSLTEKGKFFLKLAAVQRPYPAPTKGL